MKTHFRTTRRVKTSGMHLSGRTYVPFFSKPLRNIYFSPTRHLLTLSTPEKTLQCFSDWQRLFDLNRKTHFKTSRRKGLRLPSRTTAEIHYLPFTAFHLVANDILQYYCQEKMISFDHTWLAFIRKLISTTTCKTFKSDLEQKDASSTSTVLGRNDTNHSEIQPSHTRKSPNLYDQKQQNSIEQV